MKIVDPIKHSVPAKGHTPPYRMHKYFARRPYNVFSNLVEHYTDPGDIVLDVFSGGGVTIFESLAKERRTVGVDINPLATYITKMQLFIDPDNLFDSASNKLITNVKKRISEAYHVKFADDEGVVEWTEWAYVTKCPHCGNRIILDQAHKLRNGIYLCSNKNCIGNEGVKRIDTVPDGSVPIRVKYLSSIDKTIKIRSTNDIIEQNDIENLINSDDLVFVPNVKIPLDMDRQYEDKLLAKGVKYYSDLFTNRNFLVNAVVYDEIIKLKHLYNSQVIDALYFLFSSSLRYTNNMTRVTDNWEGGNPTSMDKHAYWMPNQYVETNVVNILEKRKKALCKGFDYAKRNLPVNKKIVNSFSELTENQNSALVLNKSSSDLPIPSNSVDVIITDPPYGSNVQYTELSLLWNVWFKNFKNLDSHLNNKEEAVMNRRLPAEMGAKNAHDYEELLFNIYQEAFRVLKDSGYLVFTFNNKNINVWLAMLSAVARAGFYLPDHGVLFQDGIKAYKNTSHLKYEGNIHGDFIYSFKKHSSRKIVANSFKYSLPLEDFIDYEISTVVQNVVDKYEEISTTDLYQQIFSSIVSTLMNYLVYNQQTADNLNDKTILSNNYIDSVISKFMTYENNIWRKKSVHL